MNPHLPPLTDADKQRLLSLYATGSLTEAEQSLLYQAALDDQNLFDQLAREQSIKELVDTPGVRDRLLAKLGPAESAAPAVGDWKRPLAWSLAATFVVGMSLTAVYVMRSTMPQPLGQVAQVTEADKPAAAPVAIQPAPISPDQKTLHDQKTATAPKPASSPSANPSVDSLEKKKKADANEPTIAKEEQRDKDARADTVAALAPPPAPVASPRNAVAPQAAELRRAATAAAPPPPVQPQGFVAGQQAAQQQQPVARDAQLQTPGAAGAAASGGGGGGRQRIAPAAALASPAKAAAPRFAFDYSVEGQDLVFKFAADGYFSLHIAPGGLTIVDSRVAAGSTRREHINNNGTEADIVFSAAPQSSTGGVKLASDLKKDSVEDPNRTRIELLVRFYPPPQ